MMTPPAPLPGASSTITSATSEDTKMNDPALSIALDLIRMGAPVFVAKKNGTGKKVAGFHLPIAWQHTPCDPATLDTYEAGDALCMVTGHALDVVDVDPRNGGKASDFPKPHVYATVTTPSGGLHFFIRSTGLKKGVPAPGIDLQAGAQDGSGRGFVWIAPTRKRPKDAEGISYGEPIAYKWWGGRGPDPDEYAERDAEIDDLETFRDWARRGMNFKDRAPVIAEDEVFDANPERVSGFEERAFTTARAIEFLMPLAKDLQRAQLGQVEARANDFAAALSHFVPAFWDADGAYDMLLMQCKKSLNGTWQDGRGDWTLDKFKPVLDGRRPPADNWKAVKREESELEAALGVVKAGRIKKHYYKRSELAMLPRPVPLIDRVLYRQTIALIAGKFGTYKSFVGIAMACSLATGKPFLGNAVTEAVPVLYIAAEGVSGIQGRVLAWEAENGPVPDSFGVISVSAQLTDPDDMAELAELIRESGALVVFWDTLHRNAAGVEENSATEMSAVIKALDALRETTGITSVLMHHTGHGGERSRGSSSIEDDIDTAFVIKLADPEDRSEYNQRTITHRKTKDGELIADMDIRLNKHEESGSAVIALGQAPERDGDEFMIGSLVLKEWKLRLDTVTDGDSGVPTTTRDPAKDSISKRLKDRYPEMKWRKEDLLSAVKAWREEL